MFNSFAKLQFVGEELNIEMRYKITAKDDIDILMTARLEMI